MRFPLLTLVVGFLCVGLGAHTKAEEAPASSSISARESIFITGVAFSGNAVFGADALNEVAKPFLNRQLRLPELNELRQQLTLFYVDRGYINSGAVIPDQTLGNGVLSVLIIEGRLNTIAVTGNDRLSSDYVAKRLSPNADSPLNIEALQGHLLHLKSNPLIASVNARLKPGQHPGESALDVEVKEAQAYQVTLLLDNSRAPSIGSERLGVEAVHRNVTGHGDSIRLNVGTTQGDTDSALDYLFPLTAGDTTIGVHYSDNDALVVDDAFKAINIKSKGNSTAISLRTPWWMGPGKEFALQARLERRTSQTSLLGVPYSFTAGPQNGESIVSVLRFTQEWLDATPQRIVSLTSTFSHGGGYFGATVNTSDPDSRFDHWAGHATWAQRLNDRDDSVHVRVGAQVAKDTLLSLEKVSIGGMDTVRGFPENYMVRDNMRTLSIEGHVPVKSVSTPLEIIPFIDAGVGWDNGDGTSNKSIHSVGIGVDWQPRPGTRARLFYGHAFNKPDSNGSNIQDKGIHFRLSMDCF